jgi:hypothetical protein
MRSIVTLFTLAFVLYGCATSYSISEGRFKDNRTYIAACCIRMRASFPDSSSLMMSQMFFYLHSKPFYFLNFQASPHPLGAIKPAFLGRDVIIVTLYLDGQRYGQVIAEDAQMMKQPAVIVPEEFYKQLPSTKSVIITYIVARGETFISKFVAELDKEAIQKMIEFYQTVQSKDAKKS